MSLSIVDAELFSVTDSSLTLFFRVEDAAGPVDSPARVLVDGEVRAVSDGPAGTRRVRVEGLTPETRYRVAIEVAGAPTTTPDRYLPETVDTLPRPEGHCVGSFATLNDLHFGEPRFGGTLTSDFEYGDSQPGFPAISEHDTEIPYWRFMNDDAVAEINSLDVDTTIIKGDIADRGRREQFEAAAACFASLRAPHHAFLGNHDYYGLHEGQEIDGYALLGQPPAPRCVDLGGWRLVLLETALPGEHHGVFSEDRLRWLSRTLEETRELAMPTLLFMHHQPVPAEHRDSYPNTIGIRSDHSQQLFELVGRNLQVAAVLIGHTHRNRVRRYAASGPVPFVEVSSTKDYPGSFAHYRLHEDGCFQQEVRRTSSRRALDHSTRCRAAFRGAYRDFALGPLSSRSFLAGASPIRASSA